MPRGAYIGENYITNGFTDSIYFTFCKKLILLTKPMTSADGLPFLLFKN